MTRKEIVCLLAAVVAVVIAFFSLPYDRGDGVKAVADHKTISAYGVSSRLIRTQLPSSSTDREQFELIESVSQREGYEVLSYIDVNHRPGVISSKTVTTKQGPRITLFLMRIPRSMPLTSLWVGVSSQEKQEKKVDLLYESKSERLYGLMVPNIFPPYSLILGFGAQPERHLNVVVVLEE